MDVSSLDRERIGWWLLVAAIGAAALFVAYRLVGTFVFGLFVYYATRPAYRYVRRAVPSDGAAAALSLLLVSLPAILVVAYLALQGLTELTPELQAYRTFLQPYVDVSALTSHPVQTLAGLVENPSQSQLRTVFNTWARYLGFAAGVLETLFVGVLFAFYLLRDDDRVGAWFRGTVGGEGSAAYAYVTAVDRDLETVYFSNVLLVVLVAVLSATAYNVYNLVAPAPVAIPYPTALGLLTGFASLVPIIVGKLVYVPLVAYLGLQAARVDGGSLFVYPLALAAVAFVVLDFVPLTFLLPELAGRQTHVGLIMFAYLVGSILFGWYGLFLGPLLVVLGTQVVRIALTELLHGHRVTPEVRAADDIGADPPE